MSIQSRVYLRYEEHHPPLLFVYVKTFPLKRCKIGFVVCFSDLNLEFTWHFERFE